VRFLAFRRHAVNEEELSAYLDGRLSAGKRQRVENHVEACAGCSRKLAEMRLLVAEMRALPEAKAPRSFTLSPELAAATRREGNRARDQERSAARRVYLGFSGATAVAAVLLIGIVAGDAGFFSRGGETQSSTPVTTSMSRKETAGLPQAAGQADKSFQPDTATGEGGTSPGLPPTAGATLSDGQNYGYLTPPPEPLNPGEGSGLVPPATPLPGLDLSNPSAQATPPANSAMPLLPGASQLKSAQAQPVEKGSSHVWLWIVEGAMGGLVVGFGASAFWMRRRWNQVNRS
jgi:Putative zinc-finger